MANTHARAHSIDTQKDTRGGGGEMNSAKVSNQKKSKSHPTKSSVVDCSADVVLHSG